VAPSRIEPPSTLLSKQWKLVCGISIAYYVVIVWACRALYTGHPIETCAADSSYCPDIASATPLWLLNFQTIINGSSGGAVAVHFSRMIMLVFSTKYVSSNMFSAYAASFTIMVISFSSEIIMSLGLLSAVRRNVFNVQSPIIQLLEWQVTVPLMFYLNVTLDAQKLALTAEDFVIIIGAFVSIVLLWATTMDSVPMAVLLCLAISSSALILSIGLTLKQAHGSLKGLTAKVSSAWAPPIIPPLSFHRMECMHVYYVL
jgi:hypothetical protein